MVHVRMLVWFILASRQMWMWEHFPGIVPNPITFSDTLGKGQTSNDGAHLVEDTTCVAPRSWRWAVNFFTQDTYFKDFCNNQGFVVWRSCAKFLVGTRCRPTWGAGEDDFVRANDKNDFP